jgi:glycosyltransferase involved in cell wall biosynthesis
LFKLDARSISNHLQRFPKLNLFLHRIYGSFDGRFRKHYYRKSNLEFTVLDEGSEIGIEILFDGQCLQGPTSLRGIGRYSQNFLLEYAKSYPEKLIGVYFTNLSNDRYLRDFRNLTIELNIVNIRFYLLDVFDGKSKVNLDRAKRNLISSIKLINPKVLCVLSNFEHIEHAVPYEPNEEIFSIAFVYDLIPLIYTSSVLVSRKRRVEYLRGLARLERHKLLFTISETTKKFWKELVNETSLVLNISGSALRNPVSHDLPTRRERNGVLIVGAEQPHKNLDFAISAYSNLSSEIQLLHPLTIIGIRSTGYRKYLSSISKGCLGDVTIPEYMDNSELSRQYETNALLVVPSLQEGLSLPILEAWERGLVAIAARDTAGAEIIALESATFDPKDRRSLSFIMNQFLTNESLWEEHQQNLRKRRDLFTWERTISKFDDAISENLEP